MEQRRSTKHGPRLDDELKKETQSLERGAPVEAHAEESRQHEPPGEHEHVAASRTAPAEKLGPDEHAARTELSRHLRQAAFPASREQLLAEARENEAPEPVLETLRRLPEKVRFANVHDVWAALGGSIDSVEGRPRR